MVERETERDRERQREMEWDRETERQRQTDRETEKERQRQRQRQRHRQRVYVCVTFSISFFCLCYFALFSTLNKLYKLQENLHELILSFICSLRFLVIQYSRITLQTFQKQVISDNSTAKIFEIIAIEFRIAVYLFVNFSHDIYW